MARNLSTARSAFSALGTRCSSRTAAPTRKHDNPYVEQKSWTHARKLMDWDRYDTQPLEGHINRLKIIKRQMYGRAGFTLLKARVLPLSV